MIYSIVRERTYKKSDFAFVSEDFLVSLMRAKCDDAEDAFTNEVIAAFDACIDVEDADAFDALMRKYDIAIHVMRMYEHFSEKVFAVVFLEDTTSTDVVSDFTQDYVEKVVAEYDNARKSETFQAYMNAKSRKAVARKFYALTQAKNVEEIMHDINRESDDIVRELRELLTMRSDEEITNVNIVRREQRKCVDQVAQRFFVETIDVFFDAENNAYAECETYEKNFT